MIREMVILVMMVALVASTVCAVGVAYNTESDDNTIVLQPGQVKEFELNPQNGGESPETLNLSVSGEKGTVYFKDCKCDSKLVDLQPRETNKREVIVIEVPKDVPRNSTYKISFSVKSEGREPGMIQLSTVNHGFFLVRAAPEKAVVEKKTDINYPLWIGGAIATILVVLVIVYWFNHRGKKDVQDSSEGLEHDARG